ncbi:DNA topoisomerase [Shewanella sairae]|uniref:DNA topoisomerase n=1 Tax=Shewanella sairae TaxID=190310 RepID=A0ABQ4PLA4_9GAMM|nr:DNA topoisomerase [Shewanella sairae]MCL1131879.1 DNA topoisomerase [Shewanella sairae]GIU48824.1 DNA topoisomerase [Shewanella sairae]
MIRLFIAEKPSLAQAIFEGLGGNPKTQKLNGYYQHGNDIVTWCVGHLLELCPPENQWKLEYLPIKSSFPPKLQPIAKTKSQLDTVLSLMTKAQLIVNAGDPDEEGQLLVDEVLTYANNTKPVKRLLVADLNLAPVQAALNDLKNNDDYQGLTKSALARSIGDQLFGFNMTQAFTLQARKAGFDSVLSIGRVQTVVLGMVNERTLANQNHKESFYYDVVGTFNVNNGQVQAKYQTTPNDDIDDKKRLINESEANSIAAESLQQQAVIVNAATQETKAIAPRPFNLSTLQQLCAKKWGYTAEETLNTVQSLYETHKLLTYPRTDNRFLGDTHYEQRQSILDSICVTIPSLKDAISQGDLALKHSSFNSEKIEAHHAIVPTERTGVEANLTVKERNIYELVATSFIALFYPASVRDKTNVIIEIESSKRQFQASQTVLKSQGWESLYREDIPADEPISGIDLSTLTNNTTAVVTDSNVTKKKTKPQKYHVESSLLAGMSKAGKLIKDPILRKEFEAKDKGNRDECGSIGTEATRASILKKLKERIQLVELVKMTGYKEPVWRTTKQGQEFCELLPDSFLAPDISAIWSQQQNAIRAHEMPVTEFLSNLDSFIAEHVNNVKTNGINITSDAQSCPNCETGLLIKRNGTKGTFFSCNNYPECKTSFPDKGGKPDLTKKPATISTEHSCPNCGKGLIRRKKKAIPRKKTGYFWGCSGYPTCSSAFTDKGGKPVFK